MTSDLWVMRLSLNDLWPLSHETESEWPETSESWDWVWMISDVWVMRLSLNDLWNSGKLHVKLTQIHQGHWVIIFISTSVYQITWVWMVIWYINGLLSANQNWELYKYIYQGRPINGWCLMADKWEIQCLLLLEINMSESNRFINVRQ